jgi:hypothetical protein
MITPPVPGLMGTNITRRRGRWTQWVDFQPDPVRIQKVKGQWQVNEDTWLLRGTLLTAEDFANARSSAPDSVARDADAEVSKMGRVFWVVWFLGRHAERLRRLFS